MVSAPVRVRAPIAEKYINQRTANFTRVHARAMQQWVDSGRGSEDDYFTWFRKEAERSARKWEADCQTIDRDPNLSFREKREEKNKLNRLTPAWDMLQEEAFIRTWGDPRINDRARLETLLASHADSEWIGVLREGQLQDVPKKPWEQKFHEAIMNPQDGSVPLHLNAAEIRVAVPDVSNYTFEAEEPDEPMNMDFNGVSSTLNTPAFEVAPSIVPGDYLSDREKAGFQKHMELIAKRTCPFCRTYFPKGLKPQHKGGAACKQAQSELK